MPGGQPVALVTGAARRVGAAIARRLHAAGYDLALHYRGSAGEATALAAELDAARAGSVLALQADLAEFDRLPELVARTVGRFGRLDALVNNASGFEPAAFGGSSGWRKVGRWKVMAFLLGRGRPGERTRRVPPGPTPGPGPGSGWPRAGRRNW